MMNISIDFNNRLASNLLSQNRLDSKFHIEANKPKYYIKSSFLEKYRKSWHILETWTKIF